MPTTIHGTNGITFNDGSTQTTRPAVGFRNRIINGDMRIDQRSSGAAYAITTGTTYGSCDRWGSLAAANGVWTQFRTATTLTDLPFAMRVQRTAGSTSTAAAYIGQVIETTNCQDLAGQSITLSYYATAGANFSAASSLIYAEVWTGTGSDQGWGALNTVTWTGQTAIINSAQPITTTRTRYSVTAAVPAGVKEIAIRFYAVGTGTAGASDFFQILGVQLEQGSTATEFERRPIGTELALCQRYYVRYAETGQRFYGGRTEGTTFAIPAWSLPVEMRAIPTAATGTIGGITLNDGGVTAVATSLTSQFCTSKLLAVGLTASGGGMTNFRSLFVTFTAGSYLDASAEL